TVINVGAKGSEASQTYECRECGLPFNGGHDLDCNLFAVERVLENQSRRIEELEKEQAEHLALIMNASGSMISLRVERDRLKNENDKLDIRLAEANESVNREMRLLLAEEDKVAALKARVDELEGLLRAILADNAGQDHGFETDEDLWETAESSLSPVETQTYKEGETLPGGYQVPQGQTAAVTGDFSISVEPEAESVPSSWVWHTRRGAGLTDLPFKDWLSRRSDNGAACNACAAMHLIEMVGNHCAICSEG
ncbi:unnamed protein product, partial [marine sediment metagenome]